MGEKAIFQGSQIKVNELLISMVTLYQRPAIIAIPNFGCQRYFCLNTGDDKKTKLFYLNGG